MKRKLLSVVLVIAMLATLLVGCGGGSNGGDAAGEKSKTQEDSEDAQAPEGEDASDDAQAPESEDASDAQEADGEEASADGAQASGDAGMEGKTLGLMMYSTTTPWAINIIEAFEALCEGMGAKTVVVEAGNPQEVITAAENLLSSNVDGILCMMDGGIANQVMKVVGDKQVYISFSWTNILDTDFYDEIADNEYYAGSINSMDYDASYAMTQSCIDQGADKWVFLGMPEGSGVANDQRAVGFKKCLEDNGLELLSEARTYDKVEGSQNLITNFPDLNGFGSGLNAAKNAGGVLESAGKLGDVYMFCYEAAEDYIQDYFDQGALHGCADGVSGHMELALAQLVNAMNGEKITGDDGKAVGYRVPYLIAYNSDDFSVMYAETYGGNLVYTLEEVQEMIVRCNPGAQANLEAAIEKFSVEDLLSRRK